jgi:SpoVK/Ycf46/Vps4 family AAA+-type ATPase
LRQAIEWPRTKAKAFRALDLHPPRGILLHGPPGCAKTTLARAAAGASGVAFLSLSPAQVYASSYVGEAEAVVRRAFTLARSAAPCIIFFDEIDSIFGNSEEDTGRGSSAEARVLSTFLNEMDGIDIGSGDSATNGVLVLGATNRPWTLDAALLRPGRLGDKIIYVPPPDADARRSILEKHFGTTRMDLDYLASDEMSGLFTGAELVGACQEAKMRLLRDVMSEEGGIADRNDEPNYSMKQEYLEATLAVTKPLLSDPVALEEFRVFGMQH